MTRPFPLHTGIAEVVDVALITARMKRVTLTAPAFADFGIEQPGEIITLGWPNDSEPLILPERGWRFPRGRRKQHWRNYTVRAYRPTQAQVDVDFFLHGDAGQAAAWAERVSAGDRVGFAGPRTHWEGHDGWSLLVSDETGLPALLAILETLPAGHRAVALAEVASAGEHQRVQTEADLDLHWIGRGRLAKTTRALTLPNGPGRAWGGGEARAMRAVRDHLRTHRNVELDLLGYWKR
jgi:NADPH-dependent ferric siderophore reductase